MAQEKHPTEVEATPFVVDSRMKDGIRELLIYKATTDSWDKPYYAPTTGIGPLTEYEAACLCTALGAALGCIE